MTVFILLLEEINGKFTNTTETQKKKAKTCKTGGEGGPGTCPEWTWCRLGIPGRVRPSSFVSWSWPVVQNSACAVQTVTGPTATKNRALSRRFIHNIYCYSYSYIIFQVRRDNFCKGTVSTIFGKTRDVSNVNPKKCHRYYSKNFTDLK